MANIARHRVSANSNTSAIPYHIFILDVPSLKSPQGNTTCHAFDDIRFVLMRTSNMTYPRKDIQICLIARLQASGLGCNIGRSYIGVLGYADDLTLLSPSVNALSKMVGICEEYAKEYDIVFNCKKTVGIQFGNRCNNCVIKLNGNEIKWQRSVKHLGNIIDQKLSDVEDCRFKKSILIGNVNKFIGNYSTLKNCSKRKLFQSYCTSFYGSELWSLSSKGLE